jgi:polyisoprenoid-binding protein YceI
MSGLRRSLPLTLALALPALVAGPVRAAALETYTIDPVHSKAQFDISHLVVSTVSGKFTQFQGTIHLDPANLADSSVEVTIDAASVDTGNGMRDKDLRSANFFDVAKYPTITFKSTSVQDLGGGTLQVGGLLTIHGATRPVVIAVSRWATGPGMKPGTTVAGFRKGTVTIKRSSFGMTYLSAVVGDDVDITLSVEADRTQAAP